LRQLYIHMFQSGVALCGIYLELKYKLYLPLFPTNYHIVDKFFHRLLPL